VADLPPIPIICGPTGSGKTSVAVQLAAGFPIEIISADSRQVIKHLDIGTAKPTPDEQQAVRFHLIDLIEPGERYSAFQFIEDCDTAAGDIIGRKRIPVVVGGTGLYLKALTEGVVEIEQDRPEIRQHLEDEMARLGPEVMHRRLVELDPAEAERIHANNRVRVLRALEIYELTGRPKSELLAAGAYKKSSYAYSFYCLQPERTALYEAINQRVDTMMKAGLPEEVDRLVRRGLEPRLRRSNVIGYDELLDYLDDRCSLDEAVAAIKQNSRRYAKRQLTWFRHQADCTYFTDRPAIMTALGGVLATDWPTG